MNRIIALLAALAVFTLASCGGGAQEMRIVSASQQVYVTPTNPQGWTFNNQGGTVNWATNPEPLAGAGDESLLFTVATGWPAGARANTSDFFGTPLADIADGTVTYSTYVINDNDSDSAPYLTFSVDRDANGTADDTLFFEPAYQNGSYNTGDVVPDQGDVVEGEWHQWDATIGGWTATSKTHPAPVLTTLQNYVAEYPNALLRVVSIRGGYGVPMTGHADLLEFSFNGNTTTYNFEVVVNNDCKNGGWEALGFKNQGECVSYFNSKGLQGQQQGQGQGLE